MITTFISYSSIILLTLFMLSLLKYRLTKSEKIIGKSEVKYKAIDIGQYDYFRYFFESTFFKKRRVFLSENMNEIDFLYLNEADFKKLNSGQWTEMIKEEYTFKFKFETKRLVFGGYSCADLISYERVNHKPEIYKS